MLFHVHLYEVYTEQDITDRKGEVIGKVIVSRCKICGKCDNHYYYFSSSYLK